MPGGIRSTLRGVILGAVIVAAAGCRAAAPPADDPAALREQVRLAMARYQRAARAVDPDSIAAFYTSTATLLEPGILPVRGRDSIRAFVASFPGVKVLEATATADTIEILGSTALLWGSYFERLDFPGQPISEQRGRFVTEWTRQGDGRWLIERFYRIPLPGPPRADTSRD